MSNEDLKQLALAAIDAEAGHLTEVGWDIFRHPELGFKERRTAGVVAREFGRLGLGFHEELALTGVKATVQGRGGSGPNVAIIGELDSVLVADHPDADPETGAAHCCSHNAQITTMLGVATGPVSSGVLDELAYIWPAKLMAASVIDLLCDGASRASRIIADYDAEMTRDEYLTFMREISRIETFSG